LRTTYKNTTLEFLISKFAPAFENDTKNYLRFLVKKIGVTKDHKVKDLSLEQFEKLWRAIEKMEGPGIGIIKELPVKLKITKVKKNKKGTMMLL
jgi:ribosomal protein S13